MEAAMPEELQASSRMNHYELLGVGEEASFEELRRAYRKKALLRHPDKQGGDEDGFHEIRQAFTVLEDPARRAAYDEALEHARDRAELVLGGPEGVAGLAPDLAGGVGAARVKTAPRPGSKRGNVKALKACTESSGARAVLKALPYTTSEEAKTELLFEQVVQLPVGKEKRREWAGGLMGHEKQKLKARAKAFQKEEAARIAAGWLMQGPKTQGRPTERKRASLLPEKKTPKNNARESEAPTEGGGTLGQTPEVVSRMGEEVPFSQDEEENDTLDPATSSRS